ncbi:glycoside hydrolase family 3 C-terminal domain-containing protein [Alphaproteobacteria bacterium]|nr:glycoside hydrolase family 3 C-terminal domain-containing protein [bacterium]MDC0147395.1 glycoside hydrolase family 3 C-terminal domain-containing protein [Alphaproteobacteria bacterium]
MKQPIEFKQDADQLVAQMTLPEKASLMSGSSFWHLQPIAHLGLNKVMVSDGPHGLRKQGQHADHLGMQASVPATCFPTAVTLASSWDVKLIFAVGAAIGRECQAENVSVLLAPGINMKRNPLCGRNFEYYSEDPYMAGQMAIGFIAGVQSTGTGTSLKHFAVNNQEVDRMVVDTLVDRRTLFEIYLPAFEMSVREAQPWTLMCAYNRLNGIYCSEHEELLTGILRDRWGFHGLVMTDWGAVDNRTNGIAAGLELEMPSSGGLNDRAAIVAVEDGSLGLADLDQAASRVTQMILAAQHNDLPCEVDFEAHHALAQRAAAEGAVLLKNDSGILPLAKTGSLALIGGFAQTPRFQGAGSSQVNAFQIDTPLQAMQDRLGADQVIYAQGFDVELAACDDALIAQAVAAAQQAERAVLMVGLPALFEAEGFDRAHLRQPLQLDTLVEAVCAVNPNTVIVLSNGAPIEMPWLSQAGAVLELYLAGQAGAGALVDLLFGDISPSGKLAETFPLGLNDSPSQENFANHPRQLVYREGLNVGYRYFLTHDKPVLFPFGHGLSYTQFDYSKPRITAPWSPETGSVEVAIDITNSGKCAAAEIVQLYVHDVQSTAYRPERELKGFQKIQLQAGETASLNFTLDQRAFAYFDVSTDDWEIEAGDFEILFAASSVDVRARLALHLNEDMGRNIARLTEPPYTLMDDAALRTLGLTITPPDNIRPYHANTTLGDIRHHWLGKRLVAGVFKAVGATLGEASNKDTAVLKKMREEMVLSMRLSTVRNMSNGALTPKRFAMLLHVLNNHWLKFLGRLLRR